MYYRNLRAASQCQSQNPVKSGSGRKNWEKPDRKLCLWIGRICWFGTGRYVGRSIRFSEQRNEIEGVFSNLFEQHFLLNHLCDMFGRWFCEPSHRWNVERLMSCICLRSCYIYMKRQIFPLIHYCQRLNHQTIQTYLGIRHWEFGIWNFGISRFGGPSKAKHVTFVWQVTQNK